MNKIVIDDLKSSHIQTWSRRVVDLALPDPATIVFHDIAHSLAQQCRFTGHSTRSYSIAEHSVRCYWQAKHDHPAMGFNFHLLTLLHDSAEAYIGDLSSPLKNLVPKIKSIESDLLAAIYASVGIFGPSSKQKTIIKEIDMRMLATEKQLLIDGEIVTTDNIRWESLDNFKAYDVPLWDEFGWCFEKARDLFSQCYCTEIENL